MNPFRIRERERPKTAKKALPTLSKNTTQNKSMIKENKASTKSKSQKTNKSVDEKKACNKKKNATKKTIPTKYAAKKGQAETAKPTLKWGELSKMLGL